LRRRVGERWEIVEVGVVLRALLVLLSGVAARE
jgi:hypothetical protein